MSGVAQQGGGVKGCHHQGFPLLKEDAVFLGDFDVRLDELHGGNATQAHQDLGPQQGELVAEIADAGLLFLGLGVPVHRGAAFHNIGDIHIRLPV